MEGELVSPEGIQDGNSARHLVAIKLQPFPMVSPEEAQDVKTDYWPQRVEGYQRNNFSKPSLSHLSLHRKALNFSTWDIWVFVFFFFSYKKFFTFRLPKLCYKTSI